MKIKKYIALITTLIMGLTIFTGCVVNKKDKETVSTNVNENEINVYTTFEDDILKDYLEGFKKKYPDVKVNITRDSTGIITSKILAEKDNPKADVVWGVSAVSLLSLSNENIFEPYSPEGVDKILPQFKDSASPTKWVGVNAWETAFIINKEVLKSKGINTIPKSFEELLDPKYKGLIAMSNPVSSGTGLLTVNAILQLKGEEKGWEYLNKLNDNVSAYLHSGSQPAKMTATGEYGIGVSFGYRCIKSAKEVGSDIAEVVFPTEGSGWDMEANALVKKEGMKDISKKFLDWAISDEAMAKYAKNYAILATDMKGNIPEGYAKNPLDQLIKDNDFNWAAENRENVLEKWTKKFDGKSAPKK